MRRSVVPAIDRLAIVILCVLLAVLSAVATVAQRRAEQAATRAAEAAEQTAEAVRLGRDNQIVLDAIKADGSNQTKYIRCILLSAKEGITEAEFDACAIESGYDPGPNPDPEDND